MSKSVLLGVVGVAGLITLVLATGQCRGPGPAGTDRLAMSERRLGAEAAGAPGTQRGGWVRRQAAQPESISGGGTSGKGGSEHGVGGASPEPAGRRSSAIKRKGREQRRRVAGGVVAGSHRGEQTIQAGAAASSSGLPFDDPDVRNRMLRGHGGLAGRAAGDPIPDGDETEAVEPEEPTNEEAPVLSLFDGQDIAGVPALVADGISLDDDGAARFSTDSEFAVPIADYIDGGEGTISFWLEPGDESGEPSDGESLLQVRSRYRWKNRVQIWKNGSNLYLVFADDSGNPESGGVYRGGEWAPGERRLITMTWGDGQNALWVNGELVAESRYEGELQLSSDTVMHIGSNYKEESAGLNGTIGRFQVFNRRLEAEDVGALAANP